MKTRIILLIAMMSMLSNANAWTLTEKVAGGSALVIGGAFLYSACNTANADILDEPAEARGMDACMKILSDADKSIYITRNKIADQNRKWLKINMRQERVASGGPEEDRRIAKITILFHMRMAGAQVKSLRITPDQC